MEGWACRWVVTGQEMWSKWLKTYGPWLFVMDSQFVAYYNSAMRSWDNSESLRLNLIKIIDLCVFFWTNPSLFFTFIGFCGQKYSNFFDNDPDPVKNYN